MNFSIQLNFVKQDLKDKYAASVLGSLWAFLTPLFNIMIFAFVFSQVMGARLESFGAEFAEFGYSIYLISGILFWNSFASTLLRVANVFEEKRGILGKVGMSLITLPIYVVITEAIIFTISFTFFIGYLTVIDFPLTFYMLLIPVVYVVQQFFAYTLGYILGVLTVFIRDIKEIVTLLLQLLFWMTPIVYVVSIIPSGYQFVFEYNPFYWLVSSVRDIVISQTTPYLIPLMVIFVLSIALFVAGVFLTNRLERDIRDLI